MLDIELKLFGGDSSKDKEIKMTEDSHAFGLAIMVYIIIIASTIIIMWDPLEIFHDSIGTGLLLGAAVAIAVGVQKYRGISLRNIQQSIRNIRYNGSSTKLKQFYEYQKVVGKDRSNSRGRWRKYICSMCRSEFYSIPLLQEHKRSSHAY